jgi:hypothetical protein
VSGRTSKLDSRMPGLDSVIFGVGVGSRSGPAIALIWDAVVPSDGVG